MATWLLQYPARVPARLWLRTHLHAALQPPSPASLEIESMPYPSAHPDAALFEPMSDDYTTVSSPRQAFSPPLSSADTLVALVSKGDFTAADALRKELTAHHLPITRHTRYLRAALHAITHRRPRPSSDRLESFSAWLALAPDRHEGWQSFHDLRQRLFRDMDHLNVMLVYRFGVVLAGKGYCMGDAAMQVVSTLARYARPSVVARYLRQVEDASRAYHARMGTVQPREELSGAYSLAVRTVVLGGKGEAAPGLVSAAHSRGIRISDFTLDMVAKHAPLAIERIQALYPSWTSQKTDTATAQPDTIPTAHTTDLTELATRLRALRNALRSPCPPPPHALLSFISSYQSLRRTRAIPLLRTLAYRYSPKSAATWAFTSMLHHRARHEPLALLTVFAHSFVLIGVPRKTLLGRVRGAARQPTTESTGWTTDGCRLRARLWPSAYHTALVWEALVGLSDRPARERLYALLVSLVQRSRSRGDDAITEADAKVNTPPNAYDAAHFSPFVMAWARRGHPDRAAGVLSDMVRLGVVPSVVQWSMVARGYAQHGDAGVTLRILDRLVAAGGDGEGLLGVHTNVLRGLVCAGDVARAREVERRLAGLGYRPGGRPATDASVALLRRLEAGLDWVLLDGDMRAQRGGRRVIGRSESPRLDRCNVEQDFLELFGATTARENDVRISAGHTR